MPKSVILAPPSLADQHVLGLDVAVHDLALVRRAERARDLDRVGDRLRDLERPLAADQLLERLAVDVLEHDVGRARSPAILAVLGGLLAGVDHRDDVRVVELRDRARLAAEALELVGVGGDLAVHQLDRDRPFEHRVERAVDGRHAAAPDLARRGGSARRAGCRAGSLTCAPQARSALLWRRCAGVSSERCAASTQR